MEEVTIPISIARRVKLLLDKREQSKRREVNAKIGLALKLKHHSLNKESEDLSLKDKLIKALDEGSEIKTLKQVLKLKDLCIDIDRPIGKFRGGQDWSGMTYPINYGELRGLVNPSDGDPWDVVVPGPTTPKNSLKVSRIIGYIPFSDGNHKLIATQADNTHVNIKQLLEFVKRRRKQSEKNNDSVEIKDPVLLA